MADAFDSSRATDLSQKYALGLDDWIFLDKDTNRVLEQCRGTYRLDSAGVAAWVDLLAARQAYCASIDARHVALVAPNKEAVYAEQLPEILPLSEERPVRQIEGPSRLPACQP